MRLTRRLPIPLAVVTVAFACAQLFPATSSSFTDAVANSGNTVTAAPDWIAPTISSVVTQRSDGGTLNKLKANGTFYIYADIADSGNPSAGLGTMTASTTNIATVSSTTLTAGSWTINGTTYDARSPLLTTKGGLNTGTFTYSISVADSASNGPTAKSGSITTDITAFNVSSYLGTNVTTNGKAAAGDKIAFTYNKAPEPDALWTGWDGTSKLVTVRLADGGLYGWSSTNQDVVGITDATGNVTDFGYVVTGGNYVNNSHMVNFNNSTMVLSGNTVTVTLGTPDIPSYLLTDTGNRVATWYGAGGATDTWANPLSTTNVSTTARVQF